MGPYSRTSTAIQDSVTQEAVLSFLIPVVYNEELTVAAPLRRVLALGSILKEFDKLWARRPAMSSSIDLAAR